MLYLRRFVVAALAALAATSPVLAEQRLTPSQPVALVRSSAQDLPTQNVDTTAFGVAGVPRGGKKADAAPAAFVSQSASVLMGLILALNSGFINGCALSGVLAADGSSQAVSAVTASWTNSALGLAAGNMAKFGFLGKVLGSYIFGSLVAGYCQPNPSPFLVSSSSYGLPLTIAAGSMIIAKMFLDDASSVKLGFYVLAIANGINNSVTSTMTSNLCRTAHFSGISSGKNEFVIADSMNQIPTCFFAVTGARKRYFLISQSLIHSLAFILLFHLLPFPNHDGSAVDNRHGYLHWTNPSWKQGQSFQAQGFRRIGSLLLVWWLLELRDFQDVRLVQFVHLCFGLLIRCRRLRQGCQEDVCLEKKNGNHHFGNHCCYSVEK